MGSNRLDCLQPSLRVFRIGRLLVPRGMAVVCYQTRRFCFRVWARCYFPPPEEISDLGGCRAVSAGAVGGPTAHPRQLNQYVHCRRPDTLLAVVRPWLGCIRRPSAAAGGSGKILSARFVLTFDARPSPPKTKQHEHRVRAVFVWGERPRIKCKNKISTTIAKTRGLGGPGATWRGPPCGAVPAGLISSKSKARGPGGCATCS